MNRVVKEIINRIYKENDCDFFLEKCSQILTLPKKLHTVIEDNGIKIVEYKKPDIYPSAKWKFHFKKVVKGEFEASFSSVLLISKLIKVFYLQHEFIVINKDEDRILPDLDGFSGQAYSKSQYNFDDEICKSLLELGFIRLTYAEISETVPDLFFPEEVTIFGSQVTVEYLVFEDILSPCPKN
ncbi:MAG: hypothetical protein KME16_10840 [Scytolyngbya sp. HA4215-MV1]|jgi:hypothetical protein|nr:hypothetical protein [Scytolyngbya sp. HA4215-MV1]